MQKRKNKKTTVIRKCHGFHKFQQYSISSYFAYVA